MSDKQLAFEDMPRPVGEFILTQKDIQYMQKFDGAWFHYQDVCTLLQRYAASQPPAVKGGMPPLDKPTLTDEDMKAWEQSEAEERTVKGAVWVKGEYELAFIPCASDDPRRIGAYQSTDGESEFSVRELHLPVEPKGAVWVKANDRFPIRKKVIAKMRIGHLNKDVVGYASSSTGEMITFDWEISTVTLRIGHEEMNGLLWLDESESPTAAGDGKEAIEFADWIAVQGYRHLDNGVWAQEGIVNSLTTTAQLYDYYLTDKNK